MLLDDEIGYAEKIGNDGSQYEVFFISFDEQNSVWTYDKDYSTIPKESIMKHVPNVGGDYAKSWLKLGFFQETNNGVTTFIKMSEDIDNGHSDDTISVQSIGKSSDGTQDLDSIDSFSESEDYDDEEYDDSFIDDESVQWDKDTQGNNNCKCETCSTLKANNVLFEQWQPTDVMGKYIKNVINSIEQRSYLENDNLNFSSGGCTSNT